MNIYLKSSRRRHESLLLDCTTDIPLRNIDVNFLVVLEDKSAVRINHLGTMNVCGKIYEHSVKYLLKYFNLDQSIQLND